MAQLMSPRWLQFSIRSLFVAMLLCAVAVRLWPWRQEGGPDPTWREMLFEAADALRNIPEITWTSTDGSVIRVTAKNVGNTTLQYSAAGPQHVQLFQEIHVSGKWTQSNWDWCGTGKELFEIPPNNAAELEVSFWDDQTRERMLANFSEKGTNRSGLVVLATELND